jgi:putative endopeptidase
MKIIYSLPFLTLAFVSCEDKSSSNEAKDSSSKVEQKAIESDTLQSLEFEYMDTTVSPRNDFYEFACGDWLKNNPIPEEESRWSSFNVLGERNNNVLKEILENASSKEFDNGSAHQLIGDYYTSFIDTVKRNKQGIKYLKPELAHIDKIESREDLIKEIAHLHDIGVPAFFSCYVAQDAKRNTKYRLHVSQGGLGLPNKNYYFKKDERSEKVRAGYDAYVNSLFNITGIETSTKKPAELIPFYIESKLAEVSKGPVELRDVEENYNKTASGLFNASYPNIGWNSYLKERGISNVDTIILRQPRFIIGLDKLIQEESMEDLKIYLKWKLINSSSDRLTTEIAKENFNFYNTVMRGTKVQKPVWKQGIEAVTNSAIGEALGQAFVEENFSEEAKVIITEMVDNITLVFEDRISKLDWMSPETKAKAKAKLATFAKKMGFPDEWKDYSSLSINKDSYYQNVINSERFNAAENLSKLGKEIDKVEWGMVPHIVNAYYNPLLNEIVFPAGIMQKPFFSEHYEDAVNYARMGAVIGHEFTHGFDDKGAKYDDIGQINDWWTAEDKKKFGEKTQKLIDQYNSFEVLKGVFVDGELTLGENIADFGGLTIAYHAYKRSLEGKKQEEINGYSPSQRFFIAFAHVWKNNIRDDALMTRVTTDPHSPGKYRVNGTLSNMPEFFEAFDVKEGDSMRQPADKIAKIW